MFELQPQKTAKIQQHIQYIVELPHSASLDSDTSPRSPAIIQTIDIQRKQNAEIEVIFVVADVGLSGC